MWLNEPLPFIQDFIGDLDRGLQVDNPEVKLSSTQRGWLGFCLMGIILTNSICWARFERMSLGKYKIAALSWMFRKSKLPWALMLQIGVGLILKKYGITAGVIVTDDTDHQRSKKTPKLFRVHKIKDKSSGGYINGQNIVLLMLVTEKVSLPVGFEIYQPDPAKQAWVKEDKRLQKKGIKKRNRPSAPANDPQYLTKSQLVLRLMVQFKHHHPQIKVKAVVAIVEVFFEDWKSYEGWAQLSKQTGAEGTSYGVTLSLLLDLCLLLHPRQLACIEHKLPAFTVGSLLRMIQMEALLLQVEQLLQSANPAEQLTRLASLVHEFFILQPSGKHMIGRDLGRLEPTPSLNRRAMA